MSSMKPPKIEELKTELEELQNPTDRPAKDAPKASVQLVDRQRLLAAWESNVNTMRGVLQQLTNVQSTNLITRIVALVSVCFNLLLLAFVMLQLSKIVDLVQRIESTHQGRQRQTVEQLLNE